MTLISARALADLLASGQAVRLLDVRWSLAEPDGRAAYLAGHLPGAVWVDLETELSRKGRPDEGRHPLPAPGDLQDAARRWGICDRDVVVAYDDAGGVPAARAWWLLRRAGVDVRVLDGGIAAWRAAGFGVEAGAVSPPVGDVTLRGPGADVIDIEQVGTFPATGVLIDARAGARYRGETEPMDPIAGHIPGAVCVPASDLVREDGTLKDADGLRAAFAAAGVTEGVAVAAYCGSGVTAAHTVLALSLLGVEAVLFPGSWSAWSNTPGFPVAVGPTPSGDVRTR